MTAIKLIIYFDGSFWAASAELHDDLGQRAARYVFGAQPTGPQIYRFALSRLWKLPFYAAQTSVVPKQKAVNPKRMQKLAAKELTCGRGIKKARAAIAAAQEALKTEAHGRTRAETQAEARRKFELKQLKRRKKHRGR